MNHIILLSKKSLGRQQIGMFYLPLNFFVRITSEPVLMPSQPDSNLLYKDNKYANGNTICRFLKPKTFEGAYNFLHINNK